MTGLSMRTLFEACCEEVEIRAVCAASAKWDAWRAGEPDDMAEGWIIAHRRAGKFTDALLAKIDATEAQMRADAEEIAELKGVSHAATMLLFQMWSVSAHGAEGDNGPVCWCNLCFGHARYAGLDSLYDIEHEEGCAVAKLDLALRSQK